MHSNKKADRSRIRSKTFDIPGRNKRTFSGFHFMETSRPRQCKVCGSDYMRWAEDEICQRCLQRFEFKFHENAKTNGGRQ